MYCHNFLHLLTSTAARPVLAIWAVRLPPTSSLAPSWTRWSPLCKFEPRRLPCPSLLRLGTFLTGSPAVDPAASGPVGMIPNYVLSFFLFSSRCPWQIIAIDIFVLSLDLSFENIRRCHYVRKEMLSRFLIDMVLERSFLLRLSNNTSIGPSLDHTEQTHIPDSW